MSYDYDEESDGPDYEADEQAAREWARKLLADPESWVCLDSETTGLYDAEPVQIGVVSPAGDVLLDTLCMPTGTMDPKAEAVHGISLEQLRAANAPSFAEVWPKLVEATAGKLIVIYNSAFDCSILQNACRIAGVEWLPNEFQCAMTWYAQWVGDWNDYHGNYRWQKLPPVKGVKAHTAVADCKATLAVIAKMAADGTT